MSLLDRYDRAQAHSMREAASERKSLEEYSLIKIKERLLRDWHPEYEPESILPPHEYISGQNTFSERATLIQLKDIVSADVMTRKTKILCTLGPASASKETLGALVDSGLNIARLNFSHGDHPSQLKMLNTFREVCAEKGKLRATLLDTKGPEIRTAMLRDGVNIELERGQDIVVEAVGDRYTQFEGYKDEKETRIGLSYAKLCQSVKPGNRILLSDGTIVIEVKEILSDTELRGTVLNSKALGQRKNCNLPGVVVDLPVLMEKDIDDLQNFACKHKMDFVAASFVQSADDVRFVRRVLDEAGGEQIKIICKIENMAGLANFQDILQVTDGIMVARGDLGMEIPSEKVPLAQKMMITECNCTGKFVICATQMLESMIDNPLPTRAEMTDVANAVYDGCDAVMLSGESANGKFPAAAVHHMADIVANAEVGVDYYKQFNFIRYWATQQTKVPLSSAESLMCSVAMEAVLFNEDTTGLRRHHRLRNACCVVVKTESGRLAQLITKYRPPAVVFAASPNEQTVRQANALFGIYGLKVESHDVPNEELATRALERLKQISDANIKQVKVIMVTGSDGRAADDDPVVMYEKHDETGITHAKSTGVALTTAAGTPLEAKGTRSLRSTKTNLPLINKPVTKKRNTNIICTMGPACWTEEGMAQLIDAGCDVIRLNFSHGDHASHFETLSRWRKVTARKAEDMMAAAGTESAPMWATLLDTKGPEIRTAMLRGGQPIALERGQTIVIEAVGDAYTEFEGFKDEKETRIGLSYAKLCSSVSPGDRILLADGTISIRVEKILSGNELSGTVLNAKELGQRKNCNLPGIKVELPVLTEKDIRDLKEFGCRHGVDYIAASFVQSAADVRFIRSVLDEAGGFDIKIISKIENQEGLNNFREILRETDGVMVARGDLGMEIPSSKVPLAQKMMITQCNLAAKFVVCATQMLESMIKNPRPTRAEMTDVANAVIDGADAVMLSGESANGAFPALAASTMAALCANAEQTVDQHRRYNFIRAQTPSPLESAEAVCSSAVQMALDMKARAIICFTTSGRAAPLLSKYRPTMPVFVVSPEESIVRLCRAAFALHGVFLDFEGEPVKAATERVVAHLNALGTAKLVPGDQLVVVSRRALETGNVLDDQRLAARAFIVGDKPSIEIPYKAPHGTDTTTIMYRSTKIGLDTILDKDKYKHVVRKGKIVCTLGPACSSEEMLGALLDAGMDVARFNFSHGSHESQLEVLQRFRAVAAARKSNAACLLDTKGPEIRTAMLRGGANIQLKRGQSIIIEAVGDRYTQFEGYTDESETRIGLSYAKLCQSVKPGNRILLADGTISIDVTEILSDTELKGTVLNSKALGQRKNCNLPGVHVDLPVLMEKDIDDLQNFAAKHKMDFVAASFVQTADDVRFVRRVLDEAGGEDVKIICKIENQEGLRNYDAILEVTDGIMIARGDLGMEIPVQKVPIAQKMMCARANLAGKFVIVATQMMESMIENPYPTRAEMTDVANAVFDGTDAVMLSGETANGQNPDVAVKVMASIVTDAEIGVNHNQNYNFVRSFTPKPVGTVEAVVSTMAKNAVDIRPGMLVVFSESGKMARLVAKYRPCAPVLVVTSNARLARACSVYFATRAMLLEKPMANRAQIFSTLKKSLQFGVSSGLCVPGKEVVVLASTAATASGVGKGAERELFVTVAPGRLQYSKLGTLVPNLGLDIESDFVAKTISLRSVRVSVPMLFEPTKTLRKTKIIATMGPASCKAETVKAMVTSGMDVMRLNLAHNTHDGLTPDVLLSTYREACESLGRLPCVMVDLQGSELRSSWLLDRETGQPAESLKLSAGQEVTLFGSSTTDPHTFTSYADEEDVRIGICFEKLGEVALQDTVIRMSDGSVALVVDEVLSASEVRARVLNSCTLGSHKMVSISDLHLRLPFLNPKDRADVKWAVSAGVQFVAVSFTQSKEDILELRDLLSQLKGGDDVQVIAKIEDADGLKNLDEILEVVEGVMVARGDLGLQISPEKVALAQNLCTSKTNVRGKISMVSRQMLESMVVNPRPTRAEMTDVANAAFESADVLMLGDETAAGNFPVESVQTMANILCNAEEATNYYALHSFMRDFSSKPFTALEAMCACLARSAMDAPVAAVLSFTDTFAAPKIITKFRPALPHIVVTGRRQVAAQCGLYFGMLGVHWPDMARGDMKSGVKFAMDAAKRFQLYDGGLIAVLHGSGDALTADVDPRLSVIDPAAF